MRKIRIRSRLFIGYGTTIALMLAIASTGIWLMTQTYHTNRYLQERQTVTQLVVELVGQVETNASQAQALSRMVGAADIALFENSLEQTTQRINALYDELAPLIIQHEALEIYEAAKQHRQAYTEKRAEAVQYSNLGNTSASNEIFAEEIPGLLSAYISKLQQLADFQRNLVSAVVDESNTNILLGRGFVIGLSLVAVLIGLATAWLITRSIIRPLNDAVELADAVARRDLTRPINPQGNDELTRLETSLREMVHGLQDAMGQVRSGSAAIATAAAEISMGHLDLSARTEQQSSSLAETATAMEEMTTTVRNNDGHARQANALSDASAEVARAGGAAVHSLTETMGEINTKSEQMAAIVDVIDGIAFQTNILALNAAVEAARAGEQGRGFAVVASEVRALAQRSANAAREIKELIDASVAVIAQGHGQAAKADEGMQKVLESIEQVAALMDEISTASNEQTVGIEQINQAVAQMDDVTRQNASLVEEAGAAAENMDQQARQLAELVATFQLGAAQHDAPVRLTDITSKPHVAQENKANSHGKIAQQQTQQLTHQHSTSQPHGSKSVDDDTHSWDEF